MISYSIYKIIHFMGLAMAIMAIGANSLHTLNHGGENSWRKPTAITHGIGLLLLLLGGFGMIARLEIKFPWTTDMWIFAKIGIWVVMGALIALAKKPAFAKVVWWGIPLLVGFAAMMVRYKPV